MSVTSSKGGERLETSTCVSSVSCKTSLLLDNEEEFISQRDELFERGPQLKVLHESLARIEKGGVSEVVVVSGAAGVGKSALVESLRNPVMLDGDGYYCCVKFDRKSSNFPVYDPFAAITAAFSDLCDLIEQNPCNSNAMDDLDEESEEMDEDSTPEVVITAAAAFRKSLHTEYTTSLPHACFRTTCRDFCRAIAQPKRPLVLFFDNLQYAEREALEIVEAIISDNESNSTLVVAAYEDNGNATASKLRRALSLASILPTFYLKLEALGQDGVHRILLEQLSLPYSCASADATKEFAELLISRTGGVCSFLVQFINHLKHEQLLSWNEDLGKYEWEIASIQTETAATSTIGAILSLKLRRMTAEYRTVLTYAAFLGAQVARELLETVVGRYDSKQVVDRCFKWAVDQGILEEMASDGRVVQFTHERVGRSLRHKVPEGLVRLKMHHRMGIRLRDKLKEVDVNSALSRSLTFAAAEHLNAAAARLITDPSERLELVALNVSAAQFAMRIALFMGAMEHLRIGLEFIPEKWHSDHYVVTLRTSNLYARCLYCSGMFQDCILVTKEITENAATIEDKVVAFQLHVESLVALGSETAGHEIGMQYLAELNETFPAQPHYAKNVTTWMWMKHHLRKCSKGGALSLPECQDTLVRAKHKLMVLLCCLNRQDEVLSTMMCHRIMQQSLTLGFTPSTAMAYVFCGIRKQAFNQPNDAIRFADLSQQVLDRTDAEEIETRFSTYSETCILHWREPLGETVDTLCAKVDQGLALGDVNFAFQGASLWLFGCIDTGVPLQQLEGQARRLVEWAQHVHDPCASLMVKTVWQFLLNMTDDEVDCDHQCTLSGEATNEEELLDFANRSGNTMLFNTVQLCKLQLAFHTGAYAQALEIVGTFNHDLFWDSSFHFYTIVTMTALCHYSLPSTRSSRRGRKIARLFESLEKKKCPNATVPLLILQAEEISLQNKDPMEVERAYRKAIDAASEGALLNYEVIANERAARHFFQSGDLERCRPFVERAIYTSGAWSPFKAALLEEQYTSLLST